MYRIKNLVNSPYDLKTADGATVRLPARGEVEADLHPLLMPHYKAVQYFEITPLSADAIETENLDPALANTIDALRAEYERLTGEKPDGRWKENRLHDEINKALAE